MEDQSEIEVKKLGLCFFGGKHAQMRYFKSYKEVTRKGKKLMRITFLDGKPGFVERYTIRRYPQEG